MSHTFLTYVFVPLYISVYLSLSLSLSLSQIEGQYEAILQQHAGQSSIAVNQIELDLLRTLPTNKYYESPDAQGVRVQQQLIMGLYIICR